jgi:hypothetical protein
MQNEHFDCIDITKDVEMKEEGQENITHLTSN